MATLTNPMPNASPPPPAPPLPPSASSAPPAPTPSPPQGGGLNQPQPGPQPPAQPQKPQMTEGPVDPELLKKFEANCMNVVTGSLSGIIKSVQQTKNKVAALAQATVYVVVRVEDSLEQSGGQLNLAMTFAGGAATITDIADAMEKAGVANFAQNDIDNGFMTAVDQYRVIRQQQGRLNPAMFQQIVQQMKQAQQNDTLDTQYPGLTEYAAQAQKTAAKKSNAAKPPYKPKGAKQAAPAAPAPAAGFETTPGAAAATVLPASAPAAPGEPATNGDFPPALLKKKKGTHIVQAHLRRNPGKGPAPKTKAQPKVTISKGSVPGNDFAARMLAARSAKRGAGGAPAPQAATQPVNGGI